MKLRTLFITRNYPPKLGGLERYSHNLIREFSARDPVSKITLSKSNAHLVWFLPYAFCKAVDIVQRQGIETVHLCDALLAPVGLLLKTFTGARVSVTVHGLDITYANPFYQAIVPCCVARLDRVVCVSRATRDECVSRKIPYGQCVVIPNGIQPDEFFLDQPEVDLRMHLGGMAGVPLERKTVLVTVGRLVRRKGVHWFVTKVMPRLGPEYHYLIAGEGPERIRIEAAIQRYRLADRVSLLGRVTDGERNLILNGADIFIMPNITITGDVEGFGISIIEAGACGLPVIGSDLQGIKDAVIEGRSGYLVPERDAAAFVEKIISIALDRPAVRSVVTAAFAWEKLYMRYREVFTQLRSDKKENHP